ncbi:MAG TPA: hypothetical protein VMI54_12515 [Polyangiaceae bacterium]|nr:hypothetical protein [Polyangiaceae bacterium]
MKAEPDARRVRGEELGARHARGRDEVAQELGEVADARHHHDPPGAAGFLVHSAQQRQQLRLDAERARLLVVNRLGAGAIPIHGTVNRDLSVGEIDVVPLERFELPCSRTEIRRERHEPAPIERDLRARSEL